MFCLFFLPKDNQDIINKSNKEEQQGVKDDPVIINTSNKAEQQRVKG
jgi:hypothetical protein